MQPSFRRRNNLPPPPKPLPIYGFHIHPSLIKPPIAVILYFWSLKCLEASATGGVLANASARCPPFQVSPCSPKACGTMPIKRRPLIQMSMNRRRHEIFSPLCRAAASGEGGSANNQSLLTISLPSQSRNIYTIIYNKPPPLIQLYVRRPMPDVRCFPTPLTHRHQ